MSAVYGVHKDIEPQTNNEYYNFSLGPMGKEHKR